MLLFYAGSVSAISGISPSSFSVDFEPGLTREYTFYYVSDKGTKLDAYVSGSLAEYVEIISEKYVFGKKEVVVRMSLPEEIDKAGLHKIRIGTREVKKQGLSGVSVSVDIGALIRVRVPYPGKYAELKLSVSRANAGDDVPYALTINSRGDQSIFVISQLEITNDRGVIEKITLAPRTIESAKSYVYKGKINTEKYSPGDYNLTAKVDYGGESLMEVTSPFRLGELKVDILNYTKVLEKEKTNRFRIEIESLWNDPIEDVYGKVSIIGYPNIVATTPTGSIGPWQRGDIVGFIDTSGIEGDMVQANIEVFFGDKVTSKMVELQLVSETNWLLIGAIIGGIIIVILILTLMIIIIILLFKRKNEPRAKRRDK